LNWDRELSTCDPDYYKFTQWIVAEMHRRGLAYQADATVNWDPVDETVLANEQIDKDGRSWRSGAVVEQKRLKQWYLNIRAYADEMLESLDGLDKWPDAVKEAQRGWIGKSKGAEVEFEVGDGETIKVFTTRPDTIMGVTFLVLAPESQIVQEHATKNLSIQ